MKNLFYLFLFIGCIQTKKINTIMYDVQANKNKITMVITNNSNVDYCFQHPKLIFLKMHDNSNKSILTESIISEVEYGYKNFNFLPRNRSSSNPYNSVNFTIENCDSVFFKLKKKSFITLEYTINNSKDLSSGDYSLIVDKSNCKESLIGKNIPKGYIYFDKILSLPEKIRIN